MPNDAPTTGASKRKDQDVRSTILAALAALALAWTPAHAEDPKLETDDQKAFYALGVMLSQNLAQFSPTPEELAVIEMGIRDGVAGNEPKVDVAAQRANFQKLAEARQAAAAAVEKERGKEYLAEAAKGPGAEVSESGLIYTETAAGEGASPTDADQVTVHYTGKLTDGTVFDSSVERGQPATFPLRGVIPCWTEGVQKMKTGGKATLVCPSDIAYGDRGQAGRDARVRRRTHRDQGEGARSPAAGPPVIGAC
jgi:FKBP-type peptidyl-prolyl cis-trans isomerase FkpA